MSTFVRSLVNDFVAVNMDNVLEVVIEDTSSVGGFPIIYFVAARPMDRASSYIKLGANRKKRKDAEADFDLLMRIIYDKESNEKMEDQERHED